MTDDDIRHVIESQATALGPLLYGGVATSLASARTRNRGLGHEKYPHLLPMVLRAEMREYLERNLPRQDWAIGGEPRLMGQLSLLHPESNLHMRFLKERRRTYPGGVPVAGANQARREHWTQDALALPLPDVIVAPGEPVRLLLLWDFLGEDASDDFGLRIVHTLAPGIYGQPVPCDLILDVNAGGSIFSHLKFHGSPEDGDFFEIEIAEEHDGS